MEWTRENFHDLKDVYKYLRGYETDEIGYKDDIWKKTLKLRSMYDQTYFLRGYTLVRNNRESTLAEIVALRQEFQNLIGHIVPDFRVNVRFDIISLEDMEKRLLDLEDLENVTGGVKEIEERLSRVDEVKGGLYPPVDQRREEVRRILEAKLVELKR